MAERVFRAQPVLAAAGRAIVAPFQFLLTGDDNLRVVSVNSLAGVTVAIHGYRVDEDGKKHDFVHTHVPNTNRTTSTQNFLLGSGALLNLTVFVSAGAPVRGQTYVMVQLIRGFTGATVLMGTLLAGYVTATQPLGWPGSAIEDSLTGRGNLRAFGGSAPPPGSNLTDTVPTGARWRLQSYRIVFLCDATVTGRFCRIRIIRGGVIFFSHHAGVILSAGQTNEVHFGPGLTAGAFVSGAIFSHAPFPTETILLAGDQLDMIADGIQAGDTFGTSLLTVEEWLEVTT